MESVQPKEEEKLEDSANSCASKLHGKKFDILMDGANNIDTYHYFNPDGTCKSNQKMFNGAKYTIESAKQFTLYKPGKAVVWEFNSETTAFRKDKPLFSMRLAKN